MWSIVHKNGYSSIHTKIRFPLSTNRLFTLTFTRDIAHGASSSLPHQQQSHLSCRTTRPIQPVLFLYSAEYTAQHHEYPTNSHQRHHCLPCNGPGLRGLCVFIEVLGRFIKGQCSDCQRCHFYSNLCHVVVLAVCVDAPMAPSDQADL